MTYHQLDRVLDDVDTALRGLKRSLRGIPIRREGFKANHDRAARAMATLTTELSDARATITD